MAYKQKLRRSKQRKGPPSKEMPSPSPPTPQYASFVEEERRPDLVDRPAIRFVRVEDRLIKVPEGLFMQMSGRIRDSLGFTSGGGSTPERPIFLRGHTSDQFKELLSAYNAYPSLDKRTMTLDDVLTIGELAMGYEMGIFSRVVPPALADARLGPQHAPADCGFACLPAHAAARVLPRSMEGLHVHHREVDLSLALAPVAAHPGHPVRGCAWDSTLAQPRLLHVPPRRPKAPGDWEEHKRERGSQSAAGDVHQVGVSLAENDLEQTSAQRARVPDLGRWKAFAHAPCSVPDVDVLKRLSFMEKSLREDVVLDRCMAPSCKALALGAIKRRRNQMAEELHHHFDL
ncbi:hypothetical protein NLJ89_g9359 [Agrocybe chaxingu]|uniref:BTB domain-containing protein n=1 Tax=Agrocybe chaxingu TaxID=84603 RepID=A0A9W8K047_9AGAR|nr:hypothetical protein NLJ89_g9359 [Agrocybe chaxingu]